MVNSAEKRQISPQFKKTPQSLVSYVLRGNAVPFNALLMFLIIAVTSTTRTDFNRKGSPPSKLKRSQVCLQAKDLGHLNDYRVLGAAVRDMGMQVLFSVLLVRRGSLRCRSTIVCRDHVGWCWFWFLLPWDTICRSASAWERWDSPLSGATVFLPVGWGNW